jgi:integrase
VLCHHVLTDCGHAAMVWLVSLPSGMRKGEVLGLTWDDVDFDAAELTIGRRLQRVRGQLLHRETKTQARTRRYRYRRFA